MDQPSHQPMLGGPASGQVLEVESGKERRKPMFVRTESKLVLCCLAFFILLSIVLLIAIFMVVYELMEKDVCLSPQCLRTASSIIDSMDNEADPCEDFNKFVCGRWKEKHLMHDSLFKYTWFAEIKLKQEHQIQKFLEMEDDPDDPEAVKKARRLYRSCNDLEAMAENGVLALNSAFTKSIGLPLLPPLGPPPKQSWIKSVALIKKILDLDIILGFALGQRPENRSELRIIANYPKKNSLFELVGDSTKASEEIETTMELIKPFLLKFIEYIPSIVEHSIPDINKKLEKAAEDIITVMKGLRQISENENVLRANTFIEFQEYKLKDLQDRVDEFSKGGKSKIKFKQYFNTIFEKTSGIKLDFEGTDTILVPNEPYFEELTQFLDGISEHQLELYIWFQVLYNFAPHINLNLAILKRHMDEVGKVTGITEPREQLCQRTTTILMQSAVSYFIFKDPEIEVKREKVQKILSDLKDAFVSHLNQITWMDEETKAKAAKKAAAMETYVAFLDKYKNKTELDEEYSNITIREKTYFDNVRRILSEVIRKGLEQLRDPFKIDMIDFDMAEINAYYNPTGNTIFVPAGILQFPLYDLGLESLNYGSIGAILGHELTHGFDDTGRKYDEEGNLIDWWTSEANEEYTKRAKCYIEVYSNYTVPIVNKNVDGELTLAENIADNGGLVEAFHAYRKYVDENGEEKKLPGLTQFDHEQLFFISFAHAWCVDHRDVETLELDFQDVHTPEFARGNLALRNFKEFSTAWSCPEGSTMNPRKETCKMWTD